MKIKIENLTKQFANHTAVCRFNAEIESGQLIALLGPSGCGKSTMLNKMCIRDRNIRAETFCSFIYLILHTLIPL